ncbi:hypothetical protein CBE01nite_41170 [Clostridium beijerinckii]|uniref:Uncharacterized protein n=1 Tax=Clostridium beijerinckii TaxID=1520 RepID=A0AB74VFC8_CLOBE|nr:hypothetical protein [Clostridium beijerinckii]NRZ29422.1 prophage antirepressor-like protein [Clostridium beijerinckii]NYB94808.1 prophage antirepressor-like protein [Clostridium beijerinckii]OOM28044.1 hypothetical protein CLBEI_00200 [Clostridium beijerinckii]QUN35055.1 hypothetical protein KEC93_24570 [Clostridium beijerinckii]SQA99956.1 prophage antirepressor [Clostridium beijerinckii]
MYNIDFKILKRLLALAKDVAEWIEHNQVARMMEMVDEVEKLVVKILLPGYIQVREHSFLTEDELYEVLMQSRKLLYSN